MHKTGVGVEGEFLRRDNGLKLFSRHGPKLHRDHGVHLPMALQDRHIPVPTVTRCLWSGQRKYHNVKVIPITIITGKI